MPGPRPIHRLQRPFQRPSRAAWRMPRSSAVRLNSSTGCWIKRCLTWKRTSLFDHPGGSESGSSLALSMTGYGNACVFRILE